ncbi:hypothetical protein RM553_07080 [Zunongwangia sp. F363]|uniref:Uncharacterized protein n=1 Tax=Autumnicola tepida TaxID=3075595 RepID=A0ABU3C936_9FLAO|nr:hypothetical protein [Zunongwangia sp. F363]MDT0642595.1 hypothetical protein [Zunongwangia sp. F363]
MFKLPESIVDILFIGNNISKKYSDFNISELQSLAYLSCLISLYDNNPTSFWKYKFIKNDSSSPYSHDLHSNVIYLEQIGYLQSTSEGYYKLSEIGLKSLNFYNTLSTLKSRMKYLTIACNSIHIIPLNLVRAGLENDPILNAAYHNSGKKLLLDEKSIALAALYEDFYNLKVALNDDYETLFAPAIVWLESLTTNYNYDS